MSAKAIREYDGKRILIRQFKMGVTACKLDESDFVRVENSTNLETLPTDFPWLLEKKLVVKPDQLIKRRGKAGLVCLNATWAEAVAWLELHKGKEVHIGKASDKLNNFIIEPFLPHEQNEEYYVAMQSKRTGEEIMFFHEAGVDIGDVDSKAERMLVPIMEEVTADAVKERLLGKVPPERQNCLAGFVAELFRLYNLMHFTYLEINPLVVTKDVDGEFTVTPLDLAAKLDETARFVCRKYWGTTTFPVPFGRQSTPEEEFVSQLDEKTGASLKLTILNPKGRVWLMVAGGGASVIYADTVADMGAEKELANYGEYSGDPTEDLTYQYACTILKLMTKEPHPDGKVLIIGGGIANFTDVALTFTGIIRALEKYKDALLEHKIKIFVRRGGPNYQEGLKMMKVTAKKTGLPIDVRGPETHMTSIVALALGKPVSKENIAEPQVDVDPLNAIRSPMTPKTPSFDSSLPRHTHDTPLFYSGTRCIIYGMQPGAVQNMMDFDYISRREKSSVAAICYPFASGVHYRQFYWSSTEIMLPVYHKLNLCLEKFPEVDTIVNFASSRSVYESTIEMMQYSQIRSITIIAEGVPEKHTRHLLKLSKEKGICIIGPATVGGVKPGCFRIGNAGGRLDNIVTSKLYRPGSVAYVSRSGGLSNELNNIIARNTDGVFEGIAIGGDRYPITDYMDHILRFQKEPGCKIIVLLGEVGGTLEYDVCDALKDGRIKKPLVALCTGTVATYFPYDVQFGHAGALAQQALETADAKNKALTAAGALVPKSFEDFSVLIRQTFRRMVESGAIVPSAEVPPPPIPVDYAWARKLGLIRKSPGFVSTISDDRGSELTYAGMPISKVFENELGIGGVIGLLWFTRRLPPYACKFIEVILQMTADHGPAVSGAHNTIVTARAGKDLISSLVSGLLTIGPRFGGALDGAAEMFSEAFDHGLSPEEFVEKSRKENRLIHGIGHLVKSLENPDARVTLIVDFVRKNFPSHQLMDYALEVQKVTTRKKSNLILNVDGAIACAFVDLLRGCGAFTREEADEYVKMGALNGLFVVGRSVGFIGHFIDQKRLKQGLYRHPTDDIAYIASQNL